MNLPHPFEERMQRLLGAEYPAFRASLDEPPRRGLRLNLCKAPSDLPLPFSTQPVPWCPSGRLYTGDERPGLHPWHDAGVYYIQEPSAMSVAEAAAPRPGMRVLDLCAAPGGKSSHLASLMGDRGLLVSNEIHPGRAKILSRNIERMGLRNTLVTNESPARLAGRFSGFFDLVVVDAPCSGEGMFRKEEAAVTEWSPETVALCAARQDEILDEAARMLAPGGALVYSTCTFAPEEDEGSVSRFLARHPDFASAPLPDCPGSLPEQPGWIDSPAPGLEQAHRLFPHRLPGEGHFVARLVRAGQGGGIPFPLPPRSGRASEKPPRTDLSPWRQFCVDTLAAPLPGEPVLFGDTLCLLPEEVPSRAALDGLRVLRAGLVLGQLKKGRFEPDHALALALRPGELGRTLPLTAGDPRTLAYLKGETIPVPPELSGYLTVTVDGFPLGWGKASGGVLKNHYPKGLRRLG